MRHRERAQGAFRAQDKHGRWPGHTAPFMHPPFGQARGLSEAQHVTTLDDQVRSSVGLETAFATQRRSTSV